MNISKFRGKTADGEWVYGSLIKGTATNEKHPEGFTVAFIVPELPCASEPSDLWTVNMYRVDPNSVGQFTGCLDKHGNEVYEGDIVDAWSAGSHCTHGLVRFASCHFYILLNGENGPIGHWHLAPSQYTQKDEHLTVVGNVIDNADMVAGYLNYCKEHHHDWFD